MTDTDSDNSPLSPEHPGVSRRRFVALTGLLTGALAVGPLGSARSALARSAGAGGPTGARRAKDFVDQMQREPPFSFVYDGQPSKDLLARWPHVYQRTSLDASRTAHTLTWTDPRTGLVVRCSTTAYLDYPTVDWTISFKNTSHRATPMLSEVLALDTTLHGGTTPNFTVHTCNGSAAVAEDYGVVTLPLPPRAFTLFTCIGGRPMSGYFRQDPHLLSTGFPYFNIDWGGAGAIVVIGWPGQWAAEMTRDADESLHLEAGMSTIDGNQLQSGDHIRDTNLAALSLQPGEAIRTPRIVVQFWQDGDWIDAQNTWRRWMIAHNMPRPSGALPAPMAPTQDPDSGGSMLGDTAATDVEAIDACVAAHYARISGGAVDHFWMDAGWYQAPPQATDWSWTGTWTPDPTRYPHGLRPVTDHARVMGMKSIVWHEPERVRPGTWLYTQHPEWLLGPGPDGDARLLDYGNRQAWNWVVEHFDQLVRTGGIDVFRNDFNIDPLAYWNSADLPGRQGITQIKHVTGFLAFWDELLRRHPNLLIDCCASGGRRNDLESMRRSVPLWRSDDFGDPEGQQCQTYGIALWLPYYGAAMATADTYSLRSVMAPSFLILGDSALPVPTQDLVRRMLREWRGFAGDLLGDYYPLTPYSLDGSVWIAWQFNQPVQGTGVVQAFRRDTSPHSTMHFKLRGLDSAALYDVRNADEAGLTRRSGHDLMTAGLPIRLTAAPAAATLTYTRI